jgi:magnesium-transporting ATPase (P-type)
MTEKLDDNNGGLVSGRRRTTGFINKRVVVMFVVIAILVIAGLVTATFFLLKADAVSAQKIRDIFIIFMAFESILIGAALVVLAVQLAILINLLQNEIKPILDTTNETISTIRGTANFLSGNLVEPVIKLNEYVAALRKIVGFLRLPWRR